MPRQKETPRIRTLLKTKPRRIAGFLFWLFSWFLYIFFFLIFAFSSEVKEVSHKINGLRSFSIDQLSSLKRDIFCVLKQESNGKVACRFKGDNLLWSNKNCCFLVIPIYNTLILFKNQALLKDRLLGDFNMARSGLLKLKWNKWDTI